MDSETILRFLSAIGGVGVIFWAILNFGGKVFHTFFKEKVRADADIEVERARQRLGPSRLRADRFAGSQFDAYYSLWKSLAALKSAGDDLWQEANEANVQLFARQLRPTIKKVQEGAIFFDDRDYTELQSLLKAFSLYEVGKKKLIDIRSSADFNPVESSSHDIYLLTHDNRHHKEDYEVILERVRISFRNRLSRLEEAEIVLSR